MTLEPLWDDLGLPLALMGILVVFTALILVALFISVLPRIMSWFVGVDTERTLPIATTGTSDDELSEEELAVIVAAVAYAVGDPHHIVHIKTGFPSEAHWALEGRMQHHASHLPQWKGPRL